MSITKHKIKLNANDMNLTIRLSSNYGFTGSQQAIDSFTAIESDNSINDENDVEVSRLNYNDNSETLMFVFWDGTYYRNNYTTAGFTEDEIEENDYSFINSYFIFDYYDSTNPFEQTRIKRNYFTKLNANDGGTEYAITDINQLKRLILSNNYLSTVDGETTIYLKIRFYNSKTGQISLFYNDDNDETDREYFSVVISGDQWKFVHKSDTIIAKEIYDAGDYTQRVNDTNENFENLSQNFPDGKTFNVIDGTYD